MTSTCSELDHHVLYKCPWCDRLICYACYEGQPDHVKHANSEYDWERGDYFYVWCETCKVMLVDPDFWCKEDVLREELDKRHKELQYLKLVLVLMAMMLFFMK